MPPAAIHPDDRERVLRDWAGALTARAVYDVEYRLQLKSGAYRWFHVRAVPVYDWQGALVEWIGTMVAVDLGPLRARRLLALAAGLSQAATPEAVAEVIFVEGLGVLGADAGSFATVHEENGAPAGFEIVRATGYDDAVVRRYQRAHLRPDRPLTRAILTRRPVLVPSAAELEASFPAAAGEMVAIGFPAFAVVPVVYGDQVLAALNFSFRQPQAFDESTRTYLETVGQLCSQALVRARLFASEQEARTGSERIVRAIRDGFVAMDRDLRYTYVNPAAEAMLARPASEMLGRTPWEVAPGTEGSPFVVAYRAALADQRPRSVELPSVMTGTWLEAHIHPAPESLTVIFQDVTERRLSRRDAEFLAEAGRVLGSSLDYEATLDTLVRTAVPELGDWCAVDLVQESPDEEWPPRVRRIALLNADPSRTALGLELAERFPPTWADHELMTRVLRHGETGFVPIVTDEMIVTGARNAEHLDLMRRFAISSVLMVPLRARGRTLGALTLCMTESGRHYSARDCALAEELGRRAGFAVDNARLYQTAERTRVEAERANQAKSDLLAKVSHETRQPVHATLGWIDTLDMGIYGTLSPEQRDALRRIKQNQERLLSLLNDLLDMARIEAGKLELRLARVPLVALLEAVENAVLPQMRAKSLRYESVSQDPELALQADADHLAGILTNLLSNAAKFTPAGGRVTVDCAADDARVTILVVDSGIGIPASLHERVFEPFFQADSGFTRTTSGAGLGLAISREAARAMGGDIALVSEEGQGSTFILTLPRSPAP
jgi:signal transduction histidine kinase/PAS domain-containing protein